MTPFSERVAAGLKRRGVTMRRLCRAVGLDPSFFSKVLSGKRSPPVEEDVLRRIAAELELDAAELIVSAGRIPAEWSGLCSDPDLFQKVHSAATGKAPSPVRAPAGRAAQELHDRRSSARADTRLVRPATAGLAEELL